MKLTNENAFTYVIKQAEENNEKEIELITIFNTNKQMIIKVSTLKDDENDISIIAESFDSLKTQGKIFILLNTNA